MLRKSWVSMGVVAALATLAALGCKPGPITVSGSVTYRERMPLPPAAVIRVSIEDVTESDQGSRVIATAVIHPRSQVPVGYSVTVPSATLIDPKHQYGLRVRIEDARGTLMFVNDTRYGVITNGVMRQDVVVKRVAAD